MFSCTQLVVTSPLTIHHTCSRVKKLYAPLQALKVSFNTDQIRVFQLQILRPSIFSGSDSESEPAAEFNSEPSSCFEIEFLLVTPCLCSFLKGP